MEEYEVYSIGRKDGQITIDYAVFPEGAASERCKVTRSDIPHPDFTEIFLKFIDIAIDHAEIGTKSEIIISKITFLSTKNFGKGIKIAFEIDSLNKSVDNLKIVTPGYYELPKAIDTDENGNEQEFNKLSPTEAYKIKKLKEEAFAYAYHGKRQQVTLQEAAKEYEDSINGN